MAKKEVLINAQDISKVVVTATFEVDVSDNLDAAMATVRGVLDKILEKAEMEEEAIDIAVQASVKDTK